MKEKDALQELNMEKVKERETGCKGKIFVENVNLILLEERGCKKELSYNKKGKYGFVGRR